MDEDERTTERQTASFAQLIRLSLDALAARSIKLLTLLMAFTLAGACVLRPHWIGLTATGVFALVVLPVWWRRERRE